MADLILGSEHYHDLGDGSQAMGVYIAAAVPLAVNAAQSTTTVLTTSRPTQTTGGSTVDLTVGSLKELAIDVNVTAVAGTTPSLVFTLKRVGSDGIYYSIWTSASLIAVSTASASLGVGAATNVAFGDLVQLSWAITGVSASFSWTASIKGK